MPHLRNFITEKVTNYLDYLKIHSEHRYLIGDDYTYIIDQLSEDENIFEHEYKIEVRVSNGSGSAAKRTVGLMRFDRSEFRQYKLMVLV